MLSAEYRLPLLAKTDPPCSAVSAELSYLCVEATTQAINNIILQHHLCIRQNICTFISFHFANAVVVLIPAT